VASCGWWFSGGDPGANAVLSFALTTWLRGGVHSQQVCGQYHVADSLQHAWQLNCYLEDPGRLKRWTDRKMMKFNKN